MKFLTFTKYIKQKEECKNSTVKRNVVTLDADPDYETKFSYSFGVTANPSEH